MKSNDRSRRGAIPVIVLVILAAAVATGGGVLIGGFIGGESTVSVILLVAVCGFLLVSSLYVWRSGRFPGGKKDV